MEASSSHAGEGELLLPGQGAAFRPSSGRRSCRARPATSRSSSHSQPCRGVANTSYAARAVLVFWGGLGEDGSEDLPVRFGAAAVRRRGVGGFEPTVSALRLFGLNGLSSPLVCGRGRRPIHNSVCPEVIAAAV
jgi:hypothetical protein